MFFSSLRRQICVRTDWIFPAIDWIFPAIDWIFPAIDLDNPRLLISFSIDNT